MSTRSFFVFLSSLADKCPQPSVDWNPVFGNWFSWTVILHDQYFISWQLLLRFWSIKHSDVTWQINSKAWNLDTIYRNCFSTKYRTILIYDSLTIRGFPQWHKIVMQRLWNGLANYTELERWWSVCHAIIYTGQITSKCSSVTVLAMSLTLYLYKHKLLTLSAHNIWEHIV